MGKWVQIKDANWRIPYVGGWCEGYVEGAWGQATLPTATNQRTSGVYASATAAWNAQPVKHTGYPPAGITVPVYFSLGSTSLGHVAIRLDDMYVASSTRGGFWPQGYLHINIQDLISMYGKYNNGCTYLGWGEYVGRVRVVQYVEDAPPPPSTTTTTVAPTTTTTTTTVIPPSTTTTTTAASSSDHDFIQVLRALWNLILAFIAGKGKQ